MVPVASVSTCSTVIPSSAATVSATTVTQPSSEPRRYSLGLAPSSVPPSDGASETTNSNWRAWTADDSAPVEVPVAVNSARRGVGSVAGTVVVVPSVRGPSAGHLPLHSVLRYGTCSRLGVASWQDRRVPSLDPSIAARLKRDSAGLVCAVVQDDSTDQVLMVGWMDDEALHRTLTTGRATYWSRSRQEYWRKGDTSGHVQYVRSVSIDCDGDALLVRVDQVGAACHTGTRSCFDAGGDLGAAVGGQGTGDPA